MSTQSFIEDSSFKWRFPSLPLNVHSKRLQWSPRDLGLHPGSAMHPSGCQPSLRLPAGQQEPCPSDPICQAGDIWTHAGDIQTEPMVPNPPSPHSQGATLPLLLPPGPTHPFLFPPGGTPNVPRLRHCLPREALWAGFVTISSVTSNWKLLEGRGNVPVITTSLVHSSGPSVGCAHECREPRGTQARAPHSPHQMQGFTSLSSKWSQDQRRLDLATNIK